MSEAVGAAVLRVIVLASNAYAWLSVTHVGFVVYEELAETNSWWQFQAWPFSPPPSSVVSPPAMGSPLAGPQA